MVDIAVSSGARLRGLHQTIDTFQYGIGLPTDDIVQHADPVRFNRFGGFPDRIQATVRGPKIPATQKCVFRSSWPRVPESPGHSF